MRMQRGCNGDWKFGEQKTATEANNAKHRRGFRDFWAMDSSSALGRSVESRDGGQSAADWGCRHSRHGKRVSSGVSR